MKMVFIVFLLFLSTVSFCTKISDLATDSATITIDGFDVERLYFIPYYRAQYSQNEKTLRNYVNPMMKSFLPEIGNNNLLGYLFFETIDATFFQIGQGSFALYVPDEYVKGEFKPSYSKYASLSGKGLKFYNTSTMTFTMHYLGRGLTSYPLYNDAIDRSKPFKLSMELYVITKSEEKIKLEILVDVASVK